MKQKHKILILFFLIPISTICCAIIFKGLFILISLLLMEIQPILMLIYFVRLKNKRKKAEEETNKLIKENYIKVYAKTKFYSEDKYSEEELEEIFYDNTHFSIETSKNCVYGILV